MEREVDGPLNILIEEGKVAAIGKAPQTLGEVLEYNLTLPRADGTDGIYTESLKRDGNAGTCPVSPTSAPHYAVKLDWTLNSDDAYIATEIFRNYQQKSSHFCGDIKPVSPKRLILDSNGNGAVFDGIFRERIE
jgi:hypothetical protein